MHKSPVLLFQKLNRCSNKCCDCRILDDHTSVSGVQSQALDSIKDKLNDAELALQHEKHARARLEVCAKLETLYNNNNICTSSIAPFQHHRCSWCRTV